MESTVGNAALLLLIGMVTVSIVLSLVMLSGKALIALTNKYAPAPIIENQSLPLKRNNSLDPRVVAVISSTVDHITTGQGIVSSIKKAK